MDARWSISRLASESEREVNFILHIQRSFCMDDGSV